MPSVAFGRSVLKTGQPGTAVAKAHYVSREHSYGPGERKVHYIDRTDTVRVRDDLVHAEPPRNLPPWAKDAATFFGVAEREERANGIVLIEHKLSLPRALDTGQQLELVRDFVDLHLPHNPTVWALHAPPGLDGETHAHAHILASPRELDGIVRSPDTFFTRYTAAHPERGGARKTPALNQWNAPGRERQLVSDLCNVHLERAGSDERTHPGSLTSRGFADSPEPKLLPSDSYAYHSRGHVTEGMQTLLDHRATMAPHREAEQLDARQYWQDRKQDLGIIPTMDHGQALRQITRAREQAITHAPQKMTARERQASVAQSQAVIRATEHHLGALGDALEKEKTFTTPAPMPERTWFQRIFTYPPEPEPLPRPDRAHVQTVETLLAIDVAALGTPVPARGREPIAQTTERAAAIREQARTRSLAEQVRDLAQRLEDEGPQAGAALRVRLHEEREQDRDRGMSW